MYITHNLLYYNILIHITNKYYVYLNDIYLIHRLNKIK